MTVLTTALRLAFSRDDRHRWRQVSVIAGAFVATVLAASAFAALGASTDAAAKMAARSPGWATDPQSATLNVSSRGLTLDGVQFPVVWLDPAPGHESDPRVVPPGLTRLPGPGEAVLSPGLTANGYTAADFGLDPSSAGAGPQGVIGVDGVATVSEGFLYVRPPAGRSLGEGGALLSTTGYDANGGGANLEAEPDIIPPDQMAVAVGLLLALPAAFLVLNVARASSRTRAHRARVLHELGVGRARVAALLSAETAALAGLGTLAGVAAWLAVADHAQHVPLSGAVLVPDALHLTWWKLTVVSVAVVTLAAVAGARPDAERTRTRRRDGTERARSILSQLLFGGALLVMASSRWVPQESSARQQLLFTGLLGVAVGIPVALPTLCSQLGRAVATSKSPAGWLGGRRLVHDAALVARPAAAVGLVVLFAGSAFALYGRLGVVEPDAGSELDFSRFVVEWRDPQPQDFPAVAAALAPMTSLPFTADDAGQRVYLGACPVDPVPSSTMLPAPACDGGKITDEFASSFQKATTFEAEAAPAPSTADGYLVIGPHDLDQLSVMKPLAALVPGLNINQMSSPPVPWSGVGWIVSGWVIGTMTLMLLLIREIGERVHRTAHANTTPVGLGLTRRELAQVQRWSLYPPALIAVALGYLGAVVFALYGYSLGVTINYLGRITLVSVLTGALATATAALAGRIDSRAATDPAERAFD